jgi:DNA-directed RNA polymerase omega subunit
MQVYPEKIDSKFRFVLLAAVRAEQMMHGAKAKTELPGAKPCQVALKEIRTNAVEWDYGPAVAEVVVEEAPAEESEA